MQYRTSLIFSALAIWLLFTGCSKGGVQIVSAVYGSGKNFADVSQRVDDLIHHEPGFNADPGWLKADPSPGWNKTLVIIYEAKGHRHIFTIGENGRVSAHILLESIGK